MAFTKVSATPRTSDISYIALEGMKVIAASLFLSLASQVSFILPFTPIMGTFQTAAIFLIGLWLGPVKGAASVLLYLSEGASGLPVFALGQSGLGLLLGPKGGYYLGYVLTAFISGFAKKEHSIPKLFLTFLTANIATFVLGLVWLSLFVGSFQALSLGLYPFIAGDLLKIAATIAFIKGAASISK